jgi:hypothetical protein
MAKIPFMECIGSVMNLTHLTRPNIAYAVGQVSRYLQSPGQEHWKALKRILAYLRKTLKFGLRHSNKLRNQSRSRKQCHLDKPGLALIRFKIDCSSGTVVII